MEQKQPGILHTTTFQLIPVGGGFLWQGRPYLKLSTTYAYGFETATLHLDIPQRVEVEQTPIHFTLADEYRHPNALIFQKAEYYTYIGSLCTTYPSDTTLTVPSGFLAGTLTPETNLTTACFFRTAAGRFGLALPNRTSFWLDYGCLQEQDSAALVYPLKAQASIHQRTYNLYQ